MAELAILLERWRAVSGGGRGVILVPVVLGLEWAELEDVEQLYAPASWPAGVPVASGEQIKEWKSLITEVVQITSIRLEQVRLSTCSNCLAALCPSETVVPCISHSISLGAALHVLRRCVGAHIPAHAVQLSTRIDAHLLHLQADQRDEPGRSWTRHERAAGACATTPHAISLRLCLCVLQARGFQGSLAALVAGVVVERLEEVQHLPRGFYRTRSVHRDRMQLPHPTSNMVGREEEVRAVVEGLKGPAGAAVLVAGPGEGKSTVAMEAGRQIWELGLCPAGAYVVDFNGTGLHELGGWPHIQQLRAMAGEALQEWLPVS
jgi:hypothetical protein